MLIAWKVKIYKKPKYADTIKIVTWSKSIQRLYAYRDFKVFNQEGEIIGIASSKWIYINTETKSIARPEPEVVELYQSEDDSVFEENELGKLKEPLQYQSSISYTIGKEMIDVNNHVHNLYYLDLAYMAIPEDVYEQGFSEVDILYKKEIKLGETVKCMYSAEENTVVIKSEDESIIHSIIKYKN
jgi:medium-chain acyl-[acyl-carrier-protein] hydrolase